MSVLSDLFQEIADAIRTKTGEEEKFPPADFADKILSIVTGGGSTGGTGGNLMIKTGSTTTGKRTTVGHGLGQLPDLVIAVANTSLSESFPASDIGAKQRLIASYGFRSGIPGVTKLGAIALSVAYYSESESEKLLYNNSMTWFTENGIDSLTQSDENSGFISATGSVVSIGTDHDNVIPCKDGYTWVAITGLGGNYPSAEYVLF